MDIEERAEKWAHEYSMLPVQEGDEQFVTTDEGDNGDVLYLRDLVRAYLAGVAQAQADYAVEMRRSMHRPGWC